MVCQDRKAGAHGDEAEHRRLSCDIGNIMDRKVIWNYQGEAQHKQDDPIYGAAGR